MTTRIEFVAALVVGLISGCARTHYPVQAKVVSTPGVNVRVDSIRAGPAPTFEVLVGMSAAEGTVLRKVELATYDERPCESTTEVSRLARDGRAVAGTPLELTASQSLLLTFTEFETRMLLDRGAIAIDFEVEQARTIHCVRVPLLNARNGRRDADAPNWGRDQVLGIGEGLALGTVPVGWRDPRALRPDVTFQVWLGAARPSWRLGVAARGQLATVDPDPTEPSSTTQRSGGGIGLLGAQRLLSSGRLSLFAGGGYDFLVNEQARDGATVPDSRYVFHGLRFGPLLSYTLFEGVPGNPALPGNHMKWTVELDLPTYVWFGTAAAPDVSLMSGLMLGTSAVF